MTQSIRKGILLLMFSFFGLMGCANEESFEYSYFTRIGDKYDTDIIHHYIISPEGFENEIAISYPSDYEAGIEAVQLMYDMEAMEMTDEEIILTYEGNETRFERISPSVVVDENGIWYEYVVPTP